MGARAFVEPTAEHHAGLRPEDSVDGKAREELNLFYGIIGFGVVNTVGFFLAQPEADELMLNHPDRFTLFVFMKRALVGVGVAPKNNGIACVKFI